MTAEKTYVAGFKATALNIHVTKQTEKPAAACWQLGTFTCAKKTRSSFGENSQNVWTTTAVKKKQRGMWNERWQLIFDTWVNRFLAKATVAQYINTGVPRCEIGGSIPPPPMKVMNFLLLCVCWYSLNPKFSTGKYYKLYTTSTFCISFWVTVPRPSPGLCPLIPLGTSIPQILWLGPFWKFCHPPPAPLH